ncbi:MAG: hypothetical protein HKP30_10905 [Myxococcales bacterium]|nr:hypothetical protein [Myxococcales bacterium]
MRDRKTAGKLLATLEEDEPAPPDGLAARVARRVRDHITLHDLLDVTTRAFLHGAILPVAERVAWWFGARPTASPEPVSPRREEVSRGPDPPGQDAPER